MKYCVLAIVCVISLLAADHPSPGAENVNSRYKVESVELPRPIDQKISRNLRGEVESLVGQNFDPALVAELTNRLRKELHLIIRYRVERGQQPEHVRVVYEARERRWDEDDAKVTKLTYHQKQGWTAGLELGFDAGPNRFEAGWQSDSDRLLERYQGWNLGWGLQLHDRVRVRFDFEALRQTWNPATEVASLQNPEVPGLYRQSLAAMPGVTVDLAPGLSCGVGVAIRHLDLQTARALTQAANAVVGTLRFRRGERPSGSGSGQELDAGYTFHAATGVLGSDYAYNRHMVEAGYYLDRGSHHLAARAMAGTIGGQAPLFDRFSLGDTHTLRGWNKFDVAPLGGSRMAHASAGYRYRFIGVFYDTGTVWEPNETADVRHSVGVTVASREGPYLTVAFPLRGTFVPIFMLGMNF